MVAAIVVGLDIATKVWARHSLASAERQVLGPIHLRLAYNSGFAFSMARGAPALSAILSIAALVVFAGFATFARPVASTIGFGLIVGGGVANLVDRLSSPTHQVTDFVAVGGFPVFNLADAAITVGVITLLVVALLGHPLLAHR
jgi:signal peptidase II